jgi:tetratricopeptide (TPR) repeat protein
MKSYRRIAAAALAVSLLVVPLWAADDGDREAKKLLDEMLDGRSSPSSARQAEARRLVAEADGLFIEGRYLEARRLNRTAVGLDPTYEPARRGMRACEEAVAKKRPELMPDLEREIALEGTVDELVSAIERGRVYLKQGDYDNAINSFVTVTNEIDANPFSKAMKPLRDEADKLAKEARAVKANSIKGTARRGTQGPLPRPTGLPGDGPESGFRSSIGEVLDDAQASYRERDYSRTWILADVVLKLEPQNSKALYLRSLAEQGLGPRPKRRARP